MIKIAHTADWHIGTFPGPEKGGENARYLDLCDRLDEFVRQMEVEKPDVIIIAGDIFHQARTWSERGLNEVQTVIGYIRRLEKISSVIIVRGTPNHDGANHYRLLETAFPKNNKVKVLAVPRVVKIHTDNGDVQVAGLPGFDRGFFRANHPGLSKEQEDKAFSEAVNGIVAGLKAQCKEECPSILVGHYTIAGADMNGGQTAFFSKFEPVVETSTLKQAGFDLACFGHLHNPQKIIGADNVYYSGALSQLNFNDEGQKRGYFIHTIDGKSITSEFKEMDGLKFRTIRFDDEDIARIIDGDLPIPKDLNGEIIRVIYSCTDEHNKAFNHAILERALLKAGAFWVQEIVPEKISITVDKRSLEAEDGPVANLISYLKEKEHTDEDINRLLGLAKPIIDRATENFSNEKETGVFIPVEIEVKNYRNYKSETFSFDDVRFCTINGENGAGKSSLFMDAMLDALFEEPREGELTGWISNDPDVKSGSIIFTFKLGEKLFRVARSRSKKGKATLSLSEFKDGHWQNRGKEKIRETQTEIQNLLGMDSMTLKACALIMQDQYGLFLQADKEQRMAILGSILGLGIYDLMEEEAKTHLRESNHKIALYQDEQANIGFNTPSAANMRKALASIEEELTAEERKLAATSKELEESKEKLRRAEDAQQKFSQLNRSINELGEQINEKENLCSKFKMAIAEAQSFLDKEPLYQDALIKKSVLEEEERKLIQKESQKNIIDSQVLSLNSEMETIKSDSGQEQEKLEKAQAKINALEELLKKSEQLKESHDKYIDLKNQKDEMEKYREEWYRTRADLAGIEKNYEKEIAGLNTVLAKLKAEQASVEKKAGLLEESNCPFIESGNTGCIFLKDAMAAKGKLPGILEEIERVNEEIIQKQKDFEDSSAVVLAKIEKIEQVFEPAKSMELGREIELLENSEKEYQSLSGKQEEMNLYRDQFEELEQSIKRAKERLAEKNSELLKLFEQREKLNGLADEKARIKKQKALIDEALELVNQIPLYRERLSVAKERLEETKTSIEKLQEQVNELNLQRVEAGKGQRELEPYRSLITELEERISETNKYIRYLERERGDRENRLERAMETESRLNELAKNINIECQKAADYEILKKAFCPDGVPHNIIRSIVPLLEGSATNILGQMSGGRMAVEFVTDKVLKSNSRKEVNTLDIVINDADTGRLPYKSRSGGEKVKAALSVILALSEVKQKRAGIQFGFLMIDEAPFLDAQATQAYCDALEAIQDRYSDVKVMAITHDESFKARFPQSVTVYKDSDGSHVRMD